MSIVSSDITVCNNGLYVIEIHKDISKNINTLIEEVSKKYDIICALFASCKESTIVQIKRNKEKINVDIVKEIEKYLYEA